MLTGSRSARSALAVALGWLLAALALGAGVLWLPWPSLAVQVCFAGGALGALAVAGGWCLLAAAAGRLDHPDPFGGSRP